MFCFDIVRRFSPSLVCIALLKRAHAQLSIHCVASAQSQQSSLLSHTASSPLDDGCTMLCALCQYVTGDVSLTVFSHSNGRTPAARTVVEGKRRGCMSNSQL